MQNKFFQKFNSLIILSFILLTGCATTNPYQEPLANQPYANIHGQDNNNLLSTNISFFNVESIDSKNIGLLWSNESNIRLTPGPHEITGHFSFKHINFWENSTSKAASMTFHLNALAGENYTFDAVVQNDKITGWIIDGHGQQVSNKISSSYLPEGSKIVDVPELPR